MMIGADADIGLCVVWLVYSVAGIEILGENKWQRMSHNAIAEVR